MANQDAAPIVNLVQNDTGREIECNILDFDIPAGATSKLWLIKPSKKISSCDGVISGNMVTVALTDQVVAEEGMCVAQLKITKDGKTLSSFMMYFNFEEDTSTNGIISQEDIKLVETFIQEQKKKLDAYLEGKGQDIEKLKKDMPTKLDKNQGQSNENKFMRVGADGNLIPDDVPIPDVSGQIKEHNENTDSHQDIRTEVKKKANSGTTLFDYGITDAVPDLHLTDSKAHEDIRKETAKLKEDIGNKAPAIIKKASGKTIIIEDSSNLPVKALSGTGEIIVTGKNILKTEKRNEFIPFEAKAGTLFTLITNGELSEGGNIKFIDENDEEIWFAIDKGKTKKSSTIKKNVKGYVNLLFPKEGLKYCLSTGENDEYKEYVEQMITAPADSEQLKAIHTNYPTTVLTSENEISVEYVADTEAYIGKRIKEENQSLQKQILEIQNALISQKISGGGIIQVKDSAKLPIQNLRVFGKSEQNGVPSLDAPVPIVNVGEKGNVNIAIDGQPQQKLYISTPNDLPGIKVDSSGNYTDENGQQWICDLINFKSGKYLQRIYKNILDGTETWKTWGVGNGTPDNTGFYLNSNEDQHMLNRAAMSNVLPYNMGAWNGSDVGCNAGPYIMMSVKNSDLLDTTTNEKALQSFKNYLAQQKEKGTPVIFYRALKIPVERDLTPEEIKAFKALHTNYPTTVITNDENAGMELTYTVDTKSYVDSKIATLSKAIL